MADIRNGGVARGNGAKGDKSRSGLFHYVVGELKKRRWTPEQIRALLEKYPNGVAAKYRGRLADEIQRSYDKLSDNGLQTSSGGPQTGRGLSGASPSHGVARAAILEAPGRLPLSLRRPLLARLPGPLQDLRRERGLKPDMCCPPSGSSPDNCRA